MPANRFSFQHEPLSGLVVRFTAGILVKTELGFRALNSAQRRRVEQQVRAWSPVAPLLAPSDPRLVQPGELGKRPR